MDAKILSVMVSKRNGLIVESQKIRALATELGANSSIPAGAEELLETMEYAIGRFEELIRLLGGRNTPS